MDLPQVDIKKILYTTDLSTSARYAFAYALSLAKQYRAQLLFLHVLPEVPDMVDSHVVGYISAERWEAIKSQHFDDARHALIGKKRDSAAVRAVLDRFREKARGLNDDISLLADEIIVDHGNAVERILYQAKARSCDLIVMGTHGTGSLADAMLGSTARRVIRRSETPVMVVRLPDD